MVRTKRAGASLSNGAPAFFAFIRSASFSVASGLGFGTLYHAVSEMRILELLEENK